MSKAKAVRSAQEVIDQAIADNRFGEYLLYGFAIVFVTVGVILIGVGIFRNNPYAMIGGPVESVVVRAGHEVGMEKSAVPTWRSPTGSPLEPGKDSRRGGHGYPAVL